MNKGILLSLIFFIIGLCCLGYGFLIDEVSIGLVVFFPFIIANGMFGFIGILCLMLSMFVLFFYPLFFDNNWYDMKKDEGNFFSKEFNPHKKVQSGGVIFLGPLPIVFGSNKKMVKLTIVLSIIIFIFYLLYASLLLNE
jgi:uncharacterized protein (TIGR00304 family)